MFGAAMTSPRVRRAFFAGVGLTLGGVLAGVLRAQAAPSAVLPVQALTIAPFQTATFVGDQEAARLLNGLAEFSTRLLFWSDTPRAPVTAAGRTVKNAYLPYYEEWKGGRGSAARSTTAAVVQQVSDGFLSLAGPRLVQVTVADEISVGPTQAIDVMAGRSTQVPFVVQNTRATAVRLTFRDGGIDGAPPFTLDLQPRQVWGFFQELKPSGSTAAARLAVEVGDKKKEIVLPLRLHGVGRLQVSVLDELGQPTPARVYLTGADSWAYAPVGTLQRLVLGDYAQPFSGDSYFHTSGNFATELPAGQATIEVVKGMEYLPVRTAIEVRPGGRQTLEIQLKRTANLAAKGWYSGDVHVHANLFAEKRISLRDVMLVAKAEDLNVVNILPCNDPRTTVITDLQYFTGRPDAVSERNYILYVNEEMRNDLYGHVGFLNLKTFVEPAYFGFPHSPFPYDSPGNYPQAAQAKAQGGVVTYVHPGLPSEFPVDIALGVADTIDAMCQTDEEVGTRLWYRLLNCGFRCPMSAGTDSFLNIPCHLIPGAGRLYVHVGKELTYEGWIDAYKQGRSFATNGPLLQFSVSGHEAGDEIRADRGPVTLEVIGTAESIVPMDAIEIIVNGRVVRRIAAGVNKLSVQVKEQVEVAESAWVALRVRGPGHRLAPNDREVYAHTSPVYVTVGGQPVASKEDALFFIDQIDILIAKMDQRGVFANVGQRDEIVRRFRDGQDVYRKIAAGTVVKSP